MHGDVKFPATVGREIFAGIQLSRFSQFLGKLRNLATCSAYDNLVYNLEQQQQKDCVYCSVLSNIKGFLE